MAIYHRCIKCGNEFSTKLKRCPKCGTPVPKRDKKFRIKIFYDGRRINKTIVGSLALAKEIEVKIRQELISGEYYDRREKRKQEILFTDFAEKYLETDRDKKSIDREKQLLRKYIIPLIGQKQINSISPLDVEKIKRQMLKNKSPRTTEYTLAVLRHVLNKAKDWGFFTGDNPVRKVKFPKVNNRRIRFLTKEETEKLLKELKKTSRQTYEIAYLSLYTGMRAGEIFNLKWSDIDFTNGIIHIKDPKGSENRITYITEGIRGLLFNKFKKYKPKADELVFKSKNGRKITKISRTFFRTVNALGLNDNITDPRDKVVFHTLRHTFASWLVMQGTPIYTVKSLMGHKTLEMTERYSHLAPDTKRKAVERLTKDSKPSK